MKYKKQNNKTIKKLVIILSIMILTSIGSILLYRMYEGITIENYKTSEFTAIKTTKNIEEVKEYMKITNLLYIANNPECCIQEILKTNPYISNIQIIRNDKNNEVLYKKELIKIYKSKKECIVGYKPEIILYKEFDRNEENIFVYRLLTDGLYADNSSFKSNFEGRYTIRKIKVEEIKQKIQEIPFSISDESKKILRNGLELKSYIKTIYEKGLNKL